MTNNNTSAEWDFLLHICRIALRYSSSTIVTFDRIDWQKLYQLATRHRLLPLYQKGLNRTDLHRHIPPHLLSNLKQKNLYATARNLNNVKGILQLADLLAEVEWLAFKGNILAHFTYADLSARSSSDIDILINRVDYQRVKEILTEGGFQSIALPSAVENTLLRDNCEMKFERFHSDVLIYNIDVHWYIGRRALQLNIGLKYFLPWTTKAFFYGKEILILQPEALLFSVCLHHGGKECWSSLKYLCDVAAIVTTYEQRMDWNKFMILITHQGMSNIVLIGLFLTQKFIQLPLPNVVETTFYQQNIERLAEPYANILQRPLPQNYEFNLFLTRLWMHIRLRTSLKIKAKVIYYHILQMISLSPNDVQTGETPSLFNALLNKPSRIWRQYVSNK